MIRLLNLIIIFLINGATVYCQVIITGTVIDKDEERPLPGVNIVEKGTKNGTVTEIDGTYTIEVSDPNATLVFTFIGMIPSEVPLNGQRQVFLKARWDCHQDFFDSHQIMIYANSGVINNPLGGQIELASPEILGGTIKGKYSYQTNLKENAYQQGYLELAHFISNCNFVMDFRWDYRKVAYNEKIISIANSFETDLNYFRNIRIIAGYSHLNFNDTEIINNNNLSGLIIGIGTNFNIPLYPSVTAKFSVYKSKIEYQATIQGGHRSLLCFIKFYKINSFNELSIGIGSRFGYRLKARK